MIFTDKKESIMVSPATSSGYKKQQERDLLEARLINNPELDPVQAYNKAKQDVANFDAFGPMSNELQTYASGQKQEVLDSVNSLVGQEEPDVLVDTLESVASIDDQYGDIDGPEQMRVNALAPRTLTELDAAYKSAEHFAYHLVNEMVEAQDGWDVAANIAGLFGPDATKDFYETFGGVEEFDKFKEVYHSLDPEQQIEILPQFVEAVAEGYEDNPYDVAYAVGLLYGHYTGANVGFDAVMDVFAVADIAGIAKLATMGGRALKSTKTFKAMNSKAKQAENIGNGEVAAARQTAAKNEQVAEAVGTTKNDVARSADPNITVGLDDGTSLDTIAGKMDTIIRAESSRFPAPMFPANAMSKAVEEIVLQGRAASIGTANNRAFRSVGPLPEEKAAAMARVASEEARILSGESVEIQEAIAKAARDQLALTAARNSTESVADSIPTSGVVKDIETQMDQVVDAVDEPAVFTDEQISEAVDKTYNELRAQLNASGQQIAKITPVKQGSTSITYRIETESGINDRTMYFNKADLHTRTENVDPQAIKKFSSKFAQSVFSPEHVLESLDNSIVSATTFAGQQAAKMRNGLSKVWKEAEKGLTRKQNEEVNIILKAGDEEGVEEYTFAQLRAGVVETNLGSWHFTKRQYESYQQKRAFYRKLHQIKDAQLRDELGFAGFRSLTVLSDDGVATNMFARKLDETSFKGLSVDSNINVDNVVFEKAALKDRLPSLADEGYELVEYLNPRKVSGKTVTHGFVKKTDNWSDLPLRVLHYQAGYVPRTYRKGYHFVREAKKGSPIRYMFESRAEAEAYIRAQEEAGEVGLKLFRDGEFSQVERLMGEAQGFGGLITGARSRHQLKVLKDGKEISPERLSTAHSTDRYLQNVSAIMPLAQYRQAAMERWVRDVNALAKAEGRSGVSRKGFITPDDEIDLTAEMKAKMLAEREYIRENMGMATDAERLTEQLMMDLANFSAGKGKLGDDVSRWAMERADADFNNWLKGQTFSLMMGWFNPRQLFVQASNISLSMSMHPIHGAKAMAKYPAFRAYLMTPPKHRATMRKRFGITDDLAKSVEDFEASGLYDSINRQGDFNNHDLGVQHTSLEVVSKLATTGLAPFREGELTARAMAWMIAEQNLVKKGNKAASIQDRSQEALRLNMNMQHENAAMWQKAPIWGLMTQFLQVQAKWAENVLPVALGGGKRWTAQEKASAFAGQLMLYGLVGVPMASSIIAMIAGGEENVEQFVLDNPEVVEHINEGLSHTVLSLMGAENVNVSTSMSLMAGLSDNLISDLLKAGVEIANGGYSQQGFLETLTGPSATTIRRMYGAVDNLIDGVKVITTTPKLDVALPMIRENLESIAAITSTFSNARKAQLLNEMGILYSSAHKANVNVGDASTIEKLAVAMGFQYDVETLMYANRKAIESNKKDFAGIRKDMREALINFSLDGNAELFAAKKAVHYAGLTLDEQSKIDRELIETAMGSKASLDKDLQTAYKQILSTGGRNELTTDQLRLINKVNN